MVALRTIFYTSLFLSFALRLFAEETANQNLFFSGSFGISFETHYSKYDENILSLYLKQRQDPYILNVSHNSNISYQNELNVSNRVSYRRNFSPNHLSTIGYLPKEVSFYNELRLPFNVFNTNIGYKNFNLNLGSQSPDFSKLTLGGLNIFGVGGSINTKYARINTIYGTSQIGFSPYFYNIDTVKVYVPGAYERNVFGIMLGFGNLEKFSVDVNLVKSNDASNGFKPDSTVRPTESVNLSLLTAMKFSRKFGGKIEVGTSVFTQDTRAAAMDINDPSNKDIDTNSLDYRIIKEDPFKKLDDEYPFLSPILSGVRSLLNNDIRTTTSLSYAASTEWYYRERLWAVNLSSEFIGLGYKTPGYYYSYMNDYSNSSISFRWSNQRRNFNVTSRLGYRINNITDKNQFSTSSIFYHLFTNYRFSDDLRIDFSAMQYNLFSERQVINYLYPIDSSFKSDIIRLINMYSTNFRLSPSYNFKVGDYKINSQYTASYEFYNNLSQQGLKAKDIFSDRYFINTSFSTEFSNKRILRTSFAFDENPNYHRIYRMTIGGNSPISQINSTARLDLSWNNTTYQKKITINNFIIQPHLIYKYDDKTDFILRGIIKIGENARSSKLDWIKGNYFENSLFINFSRKL